MDEKKSEARKAGLSSREKILLTLLVLFALGMGWFKLVWTPIQDRQSAAINRQDTAQLLISQEQLRAARKAEMVQALEEIKEDPASAPLPMSDYNNYLNVLTELRRQLGSRVYESISGLEAPGSDEAGVYRRSVTVYNVVCADYAEARALCDSVAAGPYRCMLKSVSFVAVEGENENESDDATLTPAGSPAAAPAPAAPGAEITPPPEPEVVYHTLLTFTVTYYEQELDA